jgi:formylglycine-generating enzyme required for sulfatase activity
MRLLPMTTKRKAAAVALAIGIVAGCGSRPSGEVAPAAQRIHLKIPQTVHNSHYLAASFLYQLQTLLLDFPGTPSVMDGKLIVREGKELYLDVSRWPAQGVPLLVRIASQQPPADEMSSQEINSYMEQHYYERTHPFADLEALRSAHPYRDNPDWLTVPIDSVTFHRKRLLRVNKDRIADALTAYFDHGNRLIYPQGTVIVAESFDKQGHFSEAEVLTKRADTFWNFAVYDSQGRLAPRTLAFNEEGEPDPDGKGFVVPHGCAVCHRIDRLDLSGDGEAPERAPIRTFFQHLPARVPQIHLGPEYYDHMAFTELTEANARVKDSVFGVYGSLLLSELVGRRRLNTLSAEDRARYVRLQPLFPELLTSLDEVELITNSIGMRLMRIPAPPPGTLIGSTADDPDRGPGEERRPVGFEHSFFMAATEVTNAQFRRFRPGHHSSAYKGVALDGDDMPVVEVSYRDAQAFVDWLNAQEKERQSGLSYRLPTEQEWEYAARGGDDRRFPWGDQWPPPPGSGNFADEANGKRFAWPFLAGYRDEFLGAAPVGKYFPNSYFLYDMAGNAYEWTSTVETREARAAADHKPVSHAMRIMRGSSWADELPKVMRCAFRLPRAEDTKWVFLGFRVAADRRSAAQ